MLGLLLGQRLPTVHLGVRVWLSHGVCGSGTAERREAHEGNALLAEAMPSALDALINGHDRRT